jgi:hypothetical protein
MLSLSSLVFVLVVLALLAVLKSNSLSLNYLISLNSYLKLSKLVLL